MTFKLMKRELFQVVPATEPFYKRMIRCLNSHVVVKRLSILVFAEKWLQDDDSCVDKECKASSSQLLLVVFQVL